MEIMGIEPIFFVCKTNVLPIKLYSNFYFKLIENFVFLFKLLIFFVKFIFIFFSCFLLSILQFFGMNLKEFNAVFEYLSNFKNIFVFFFVEKLFMKPLVFKKINKSNSFFENFDSTNFLFEKYAFFILIKLL